MGEDWDTAHNHRVVRWEGTSEIHPEPLPCLSKLCSDGRQHIISGQTAVEKCFVMAEGPSSVSLCSCFLSSWHWAPLNRVLSSLHLPFRCWFTLTTPSLNLLVPRPLSPSVCPKRHIPPPTERHKDIQCEYSVHSRGIFVRYLCTDRYSYLCVCVCIHVNCFKCPLKYNSNDAILNGAIRSLW